jgi:hypothetical protein
MPENTRTMRTSSIFNYDLLRSTSSSCYLFYLKATDDRVLSRYQLRSSLCLSMLGRTWFARTISGSKQPWRASCRGRVDGAAGNHDIEFLRCSTLFWVSAAFVVSSSCAMGASLIGVEDTCAEFDLRLEV